MIEKAALQAVLAAHGLDWDGLRRQATGIALFGSRAAGCANVGSDWDLLCIGTGRTCKRDSLDLLWVEPGAVQTVEWLGGDLAGHVAAHGKWIHGEPGWSLTDVDFEAAARRKERRLIRKLVGLSRAWSLLGPAYRAHHAQLLRRDLQRWHLLRPGAPVPPSAALDASWREQSMATKEALLGALQCLDLPEDIARYMT